MKVLITQLTAFLLLTFLAEAQPTTPQFMRSGMETANEALVIVDTFRTYPNCLVLDAKKIASITVYKDSSISGSFGSSGSRRVLHMKTKGDVKFLRVREILRQYDVSSNDLQLRVCIDKVLIKHPQFILIDASEIQEVQTTTERYWAFFEDMNTGERYINIVTKPKERVLSPVAL